jgi:hypothetical protein
MNTEYRREKPMKRVVALCGVATLMLFASSARVAAVDFATVVSEDTFVTKDNVGDSDAAELAFIAAELGLDPATLTYEKINLDGPSSFEEVTGEPSGDLWAIQFSDFGITDPIAFVVKFGNADFDHYLYLNVDSLDWGVVDLDDVIAASGNITIESISHTGTVSGDQVTVQEPGSLLLMGCGLVFLSRKLRRRAA